jgi:hypothetical protein
MSKSHHIYKQQYAQSAMGDVGQPPPLDCAQPGMLVLAQTACDKLHHALLSITDAETTS